ncbi:MAG: glycosyltransferase family 9 protein [Thiohalophilus sp.]|uniref:glycosyltransferase family 9 protein n=1 Tax=Thiohalophilus sp. TaxID=3028392 RepID=UPI0028704CA9|nr:glycosyltransferase family 9 protein [Thiohalophilus sp.]MDR9437202.1 glycosyltransferase family 9 protein [Thiohalophilus sp.]
MPLPFTSPPASLCILRLSAIGDICHTLPVVRTIQQAWPQTRLTWIIGKTEYALLQGIPDIEFIVFDKARGLAAYRDVHRQLNGRRFDALLHMQIALRASLLSRLVNAPIRLGFDRARARDLQWLFTNRRIEARAHQHVMDGLFGFSQALGIKDKQLRWDIPIPAADRQKAEQLADPARPYLVISPSASSAYRNWQVDGYAQVAEYAAREHGLQVYLTGGNSAAEQQLAAAIEEKADNANLTNLVGKTSLKQLLAVLENATALISPDSGPAHMATTVDTPVIGLYACANPDRTGPYLSRQWTINHYPDAVLDKFHKPVSELPWGIRVRDPGTMDRITVEEVELTLDRLLDSHKRNTADKDNNT